MRSTHLRALIFTGIALSIVGCDQVTKYEAVAYLTRAFAARSASAGSAGFADALSDFWHLDHEHGSTRLSVLGDFWHLQYIENPGMAWSLLRNAPPAARRYFLLTTSLVAMAFIIAYARRSKPRHRATLVGLALVFGGALGNFIDRLRLGYVIDFIEWHWYDRLTWPLFNVADAAISTGVSLLLLVALLEHRQPQRSA